MKAKDSDDKRQLKTTSTCISYPNGKTSRAEYTAKPLDIACPQKFAKKNFFSQLIS